MSAAAPYPPFELATRVLSLEGQANPEAVYDALGADRFTTPLVEFRRVQERGLFQPLASVLSSLAFGALLLALTAYEFVTEDY